MCVCRTKQLNVGGANLTSFQYGNIGNQLKLIDTMKYYQQSLSSLARNTSELEKENIRSSCLKFIQNNESYSGQFNYLVDDEKNWVLDWR